MKEVARIALPPHAPDGGFDHAAVDPTSDQLYLAHPSNDAVEVIDLARRRHRRTLEGLRGVAGVWVCEEQRLLFTSNRAEDTASIFRIEDTGERELFRVPTGVRPNGIAYDAGRRILAVAGVGDPSRQGGRPSLTLVDAESGTSLAILPLPGRTRWALHHAPTDSFYVNVADPPSIVAVPSGGPAGVARIFPVPAQGPHGLEQAARGDLLYCACDEGVLLGLDLREGTIARLGSLSGPPDVLWANGHLRRLYVAVGEPGSVDIFDLDPPRPATRIPTALGAHTLTVDPRRDEVHVFLPATHEDLVLKDDAS